tara:strand:- start:958 stop:1275 length:318 start_codon:yes stop_codon:yes gene_type:complete
MAQVKKYLTWEQTEYPIQWDNNPYTWDEVFVLIEIAEAIGSGGGYTPHDAYKHLEERKKKILIKVIAKVKGEEFKEEKYKQGEITVTAEDIELVLKEVLNVQMKK